MYTHHVLLTEGFTQSVDAHEAQHSRIQGVNALVRSICRMSCFADIAHGFAHKAIGAIPNGNGGTGHIFICMHLHGHIDIVKGSFVNELTLAAEEMQLTGLQQLLTILDFNIFFSRYAEENHVTGQFAEDTGLHNTAGSAQHSSDLQIMTTGMGSAGQGVSLSAFGTTHSVQLA